MEKYTLSLLNGEAGYCFLFKYDMMFVIYENKIKRLVFITESKGIDSLHGHIDSRFKQLIENVHNIQIELVGI